MTIFPYLYFAGNCEEAFDFYREVFGGEFTEKQRFSEAPGDFDYNEGDGDKIMHVVLPLGDGHFLMGSDKPNKMGRVEVGNNFSISVQPESEAEADRIFAMLLEGGKIMMPLEKTFWGAYFGMCEDKFGLQWMVNFE